MFLPPRLKVFLRVFCLLLLVPQAGAYTPMQLALDDIWLNFTSASSPGGTPWTVHTSVADCLDDTDGMKGPARTSAGDSWVQAVITGPDTIDFMWALETTAPNTLSFTVDGVVMAACEGAPSARWEWASVEIPPGQHTLRWNYRQAGTAGGRALLDRVSHVMDSWPSLTMSPSLDVIMGEPVVETFTTKIPAISWDVYYGSLPPGLSLDASGQLTGVAGEVGLWRPLIRISAPFFTLYYRIDVRVLDKPTLISALDSRGFEFTTTSSDGAAVWQPQARGGRDDGDCIVAGLPPPSQRAPLYRPGSLSLQTTVDGPDRISYWVRVANGRVVLQLDGQEYRSHKAGPGLPGWERAWLTIPAGRHTVAWNYEAYLDHTPTAWIDDIRRLGNGRVFIGIQPFVTLLPDGTVSFEVPCDGTVTNWTATGLPPGLELNPASGLISGNPLERGVWPVRLTARGGAAGDQDDVFALVDTSIPVAAATDLPNSWWNPGPEPGARWFGQNAITHDGSDAMRSPPTRAGGSAALTTTVKGPGTLRWWWHLPAGSSGDVCGFVLDGRAPLVRISGESAWKQEAVSIPAGLHNVSWRWSPDDSGDPFEEAAVVDQIELTP